MKMFVLNAEVSFDRFGKELRFIGICLGDFVVMAQCWIVMLTLGLEEVFDFAPDPLGSLSKLKELQNFFPTSLHFYPKILLVSATDLCVFLQPGL